MRQITKSHFNRAIEVLCRNWRIFQKDNYQLSLYVTQREASGVKAMIVWFKCKGVQGMEKKTLSSNKTRKNLWMLSYPYIWEWCYKRTKKQAKNLPFATSRCGYHPDCANSFQKKSLQLIVKCPARELTETSKRDHISYRLDSEWQGFFFFLSLTFWKCLLLGDCWIIGILHDPTILQCKAQWDTCPLWTDIIWMKLNQTELQPLFPANSKHFFITCIILTLKCAVLWEDECRTNSERSLKKTKKGYSQTAQNNQEA